MNTIFISKYITLLKTFNEAEIKAFELWLQSPWCNSNKNLIRLFQKLKKYHPLFDDQKLTKEKLFKQVLPNGKFSDRRMNNLLSEGYLTAKKFLIYQHLSHQENLQKDILTKELQSRHLEDWFFRDAEKEIARLEDKIIKDWEDHLDLFQLHRRVYHHPTSSKRMKPNVSNIVEMGEHLDLVFLLEKAAIINEKIFRNRLFKNENHETDTALKKWLIASEGIANLSLDFYRRRFTYTEENRLEVYFKLREDFIKRYRELNEKDQKIHLISLLNDTNLLIKATLLDLTESLPLYRLGLKTGIILHQGKITYNTYAVIIMASNVKKEFDYTKEFIINYTKNLEEKYQSDAKNWAFAHLAYCKGNLEACSDILLKHKFQLLYFQRISKILNTQVYFDLFLKDVSYVFYLFDYFNAFERWLLREKYKSKFNNKPYLRFIQVCRVLAKAYEATDFKAEKIEKLLENETNIQAYKWLKKKVKQIVDAKK